MGAAAAITIASRAVTSSSSTTSLLNRLPLQAPTSILLSRIQAQPSMEEAPSPRPAPMRPRLNRSGLWISMGSQVPTIISRTRTLRPSRQATTTLSSTQRPIRHLRLRLRLVPHLSGAGKRIIRNPARFKEEAAVVLGADTMIADAAGAPRRCKRTITPSMPR